MVLLKRWGLATALCAQILVMPAFAWSEPITLLGVNLAMSRDDIIDVLAGHGFSCNGGSEMLCEAENASVRVGNDQITFTCGIFGSCDHGIRDISEALVEDRIVPKMERRFDTIEPFEALGNAVQGEQYCGTGPEGDILCVQMNITNNPFIFIKRGSLGGRQMNFRGEDRTHMSSGRLKLGFGN